MRSLAFVVSAVVIGGLFGVAGMQYCAKAQPIADSFEVRLQGFGQEIGADLDARFIELAQAQVKISLLEQQLAALTAQTAAQIATLEARVFALEHPVVTPPPNPIPTITAISVAAIASPVTVGQTRALTATATLSNGASQDVSLTCAWSSSPSGLAAINATGGAAILTALAPGTAQITASQSGVTSQPSSVTIISVIPPPQTGTIAQISSRIGVGSYFPGHVWLDAYDSTVPSANGGSVMHTSECRWSVTRNGQPFIDRSGPSLTFAYEDASSYVATLNLIDADGGQATSSRTFSTVSPVFDFDVTLRTSGGTFSTWAAAIADLQAKCAVSSAVKYRLTVQSGSTFTNTGSTASFGGWNPATLAVIRGESRANPPTIRQSGSGHLLNLSRWPASGGNISGLRVLDLIMLGTWAPGGSDVDSRAIAGMTSSANSMSDVLLSRLQMRNFGGHAPLHWSDQSGFSNRAQFVTLSDLNIRDNRYYNIYAAGGDQSTQMGCNVGRAFGGGFFGLCRWFATRGHYFYGNTIDVGSDIAGASAVAVYHLAFNLDSDPRTSRVYVAGNDITGKYASGPNEGASSVHNEDILIERNSFRRETEAFPRSTGDWQHIQIAANRVTVRNNRFEGVTWANSCAMVNIEAEPGSRPDTGWRIYANSFYAPPASMPCYPRAIMFSTGGSDGIRDVFVRNNAVFFAQGNIASDPDVGFYQAGSSFDAAKYLDADRNLCHFPASTRFAWVSNASMTRSQFTAFFADPNRQDLTGALRPAALGEDQNSLSSNPIWVNAQAGDLRPAAGSPLVGAGERVRGLYEDFNGVRRGAAPTIGAFEQ